MLVAALVLAGLLAQSTNPSGDVVHLSDVIYGISKYQLDYGRMLGLDTTSYPLWPKPIPGDPISIAGKSYERGLGASPGDIEMVLDGAYRAFEAEVGIQTGDEGIATFQVTVDGEVRFDSGKVKAGDPPVKVSVSLEGAQRMTITTHASGRANWANARFFTAPGVEAVEAPDMAPFARVVTWDPERLDGVRVNRLTEFPAEDVFLESEVAPGVDGAYVVPAGPGGEGCIGLQWLEARKVKRVGLIFEDSSAPAPEGVRVEAWVRRDPMALDGYSPWQGKWIPVEGEIRVADNTWELPIEGAANRLAAEGTYKVRWLFPVGFQTPPIRRLTAHTTSRWAETELILEAVEGKTGQAELELYNGAFIDPAPDAWNMNEPLRLKIRYTAPRPWELDRTVLRLRTPDLAFGVAVDDVLARDVVYVEPAGLCVRTDAGSLAEAREHAEARPTVLEEVRSRPDQTLQQALEVNYLPVQDRSPTMLSLVADNRKVIVQRSGEVGFGPTFLDFVQQRSTHRLAPTFGTGTQHDFPDSGVGDRPGYSRFLDGGWLPMPHIRVEENGAVYHQIVFVAPGDLPGAPPADGPIHPTPVAVAEYRIENPGSVPVQVTLRLKATADAENQVPAVLVPTEGGFAVKDDDTVRALIETPPAPLTAEAKGDTLEIGGECPPGTTLSFYAYMPLEWTPAAEDWAALADGAALRRKAEAYWTDFLAPAMQVDIPDELLENLLKASQIHCTLAARNEADGAQIDAWISSAYYASLDTESHAILHGMDLWGQHDFARRVIDYFIERHQPEGYLSHGYTLIGTGQHLWWTRDHFRLTGDEEWWREVAPRMARMSGWVVDQFQKTKRRDPWGALVPEYGLMPPGTVADWQDWGYTYSLNGYYYAGLAASAEALAAIDHPEADDYAAAAEELRRNIRRAYEWTTARMPVVPRRDGAWIPGSPFQALCPGSSPQFFPNYSNSWLYDSELGPHHLVDQGVLDPADPRVEYIATDLEDRHFIEFGFGAITPEATRADVFNRGGFARAQPFYGRFVQMHGWRDDVKPFIRSYFNQLSVMFNREDLTIYENPGASVWNKTFETGNFLQQSRMMFVMERGNELWLAPFVPSHWMQDGRSVSVDQAPTFFGSVSYRIDSHAGDGYIEARVDVPARSKPSAIVLRLRHPEGKPMRQVTVNGQAHDAWDAARETITLDAEGTLTVRATY